jgi:hypothetical protein
MRAAHWWMRWLRGSIGKTRPTRASDLGKREKRGPGLLDRPHGQSSRCSTHSGGWWVASVFCIAACLACENACFNHRVCCEHPGPWCSRTIAVRHRIVPLISDTVGCLSSSRWTAKKSPCWMFVWYCTILYSISVVTHSVGSVLNVIVNHDFVKQHLGCKKTILKLYLRSGRNTTVAGAVLYPKPNLKAQMCSFGTVF